MKEQNGYKSSLTELIDDATYGRFDKRKCALGGCGICLPVCPWNKPRGILHSLVRAVIKKTALFNRLLVAADKFFGYGKPMDPEKWWNLDLPTYGIDTRR
jgi:epoxyqueuosine reductase QueG